MDLQTGIHLWLMHDGAPPHLWLMHGGATPHLWLMHGGAPPHLWLMHDGTPPHSLPAFQKFLNSVFPKKKTDRTRLTNSITPPPDLNSLDFYLLEHLRSIVNSKEVSDLQDLQQRRKVDVS